MNALIPTVNPVTMSSLEMVDYINSERIADANSRYMAVQAAELRHDDFLRKVPKVLGEEVARNFAGYYKASNGKQNPMYSFPKREACLMAMSYSYDLQAKVFDRMTELEQRNSPVIAMPNFSNPAEAARAWALEYEARQQAERTKAEIGTRREATAMNTASQAVKKATALERELDKAKDYASVKRMEMLYHGTSFNWRLLKSTAAEMGVPAIDVFDANYGTVKAYHASVWMEAYAVSIDAKECA